MADNESPTLYDADYFDSDLEDEVEGIRVKAKVPVPSAEELLFDEQRDDADESWVIKNLLAHRPKGQDRQNDTVLSCPACFSQICFDCQQHERYKDQFRAMFVRNVIVRRDQILRYKVPTKAQIKSPTKAKNVAALDEEVYHPVSCAGCGTEVAVFDKDEVYHFFNVLANNSTLD